MKKLLIILMLAITCTVTDAFSQAMAAGVAFPLKVSTDGRHLVDQNNVPFIITGESAWTMLTELSDSNVDTYLNDRQARGFNTIMVMLVVHGYPGFRNSPADANGNKPFTTPGNFSAPNEAYFAHVDSVINKAGARGMLVLLAPAYMGYHCGNGVTPEGWCSEMLSNGTTVMQNYGAYVGTRYAGFPNILWLNGGDVNAGAYGATAVMEAVITGIKAHDANHLHTATGIIRLTIVTTGPGWMSTPRIPTAPAPRQPFPQITTRLPNPSSLSKVTMKTMTMHRRSNALTPRAIGRSWAGHSGPSSAMIP